MHENLKYFLVKYPSAHAKISYQWNLKKYDINTRHSNIVYSQREFRQEKRKFVEIFQGKCELV